MVSAPEEKVTEKLVTDKFEAYFLEPKLFYLKLLRDTRLEVEDVEQNIAFQRKHGVDTTCCRIVHAEKYATISKAAREYVENHAITVKAEAFIIPSIGQKILFNLYAKFRKNKNPLRAFDKLEDGIAWLKEQ
ncbi:MAG: hypothetical protein MK078_04045 [Crocinitomicaceae bacterium]|nr:hypothetical protein [Crocinitomicaceae bacterium]